MKISLVSSMIIERIMIQDDMDMSKYEGKFVKSDCGTCFGRLRVSSEYGGRVRDILEPGYMCYIDEGDEMVVYDDSDMYDMIDIPKDVFWNELRHSVVKQCFVRAGEWKYLDPDKFIRSVVHFYTLCYADADDYGFFEKFADDIARYTIYASIRELRHAEEECYTDLEDLKFGIIDTTWGEPHSMNYNDFNNIFSSFASDHNLDMENLYKRHWINVYSDMMNIFSDGDWRASYGGQAWRDIVKNLYNYESGKIDEVVFIDTALNLQHNNNIYFDKLYNERYIHYLWKLLTLKASLKKLDMWFYNMTYPEFRYIKEYRDLFRS